MSWVRCHVLGQMPYPGSGAMSWVRCYVLGAMSWVRCCVLGQVACPGSGGHFLPQNNASLYMVQCLILLWAYCQLSSYMHTCITTLVDTIAKNPTVGIIIACAQTGLDQDYHINIILAMDCCFVWPYITIHIIMHTCTCK